MMKIIQRGSGPNEYSIYVCEYAQMTTILYRESLGPLNSDYVIYRPPLTNMVGYLCIFSHLNMLQVLSCLPQYQYAFRVHLCVFPPLNMLEDFFFDFGKRGYLLSVREAGGAMAKSVTLAGCLLHASFSFSIFGSTGKGFRPLQWREFGQFIVL